MRQSQVSLRTVLTICFGVLLVVSVVYGITRTQVAITLTLLAAMIAITLDHAVVWLTRRGLRRWAAIPAVCVTAVGLWVLLAALIVPAAVEQATVLGHELPLVLDRMRRSQAFHAIDLRLDLGAAIDRLGHDVPDLVLHAANALVGILAAVVATLLLAVFMLIFGGDLVDRILTVLDTSPEQRLRGASEAFYRSVGGYIGGVAVIAGCNAVCTAIVLAIMQLPFFLPLAILSGLATLVPYAGTLVMAVLITGLALFTVGTWTAVVCAVYFIAYGQIEGNILGPIIFRRAVHVNPLVVTLSVLFLGEMAGLVGAFVAIPLVATAQVILGELLVPRREAPPVVAASALAVAASKLPSA